jgi:branched-chain amino acid transport system ATP-binding protein
MAAVIETLLEARGLSRRFGGLRAVADVSLELRPGMAHAVIGPNGAGKSTLINLLSGTIRPDAGTIHLNGTEITSLPDWRRAQAGIGRSFQRTTLFPTMTVLENARLAAQGTIRGWRLLRGARDDRDTGDRAAAALEHVGLAACMTDLAGILSHGQRRLLEIALVLATAPLILLLDEPLAGLGPEETEPVERLLRSLAESHAMLLVEHDMDVVFAVAGQVTVMVEGRVLETGTPATIRASAAVRDAYLGHRA